MQRIPSVERAELGPEGQAAYDRIVASRGAVRGPFGVLLHHPLLGERVGDLGELLRFHGVLPGAERELAILVVARTMQAAVEWVGHVGLARKEGASEAAIEVVAQQRPTDGLTTPREALVIDAVRALYAERTLSDALYQAVEATFGQQGLIELTVLSGYYGMMGFVLNTLQVGVPAGSELPFETLAVA